MMLLGLGALVAVILLVLFMRGDFKNASTLSATGQAATGQAATGQVSTDQTAVAAASLYGDRVETVDEELAAKMGMGPQTEFPLDLYAQGGSYAPRGSYAPGGGTTGGAYAPGGGGFAGGVYDAAGTFSNTQYTTTGHDLGAYGDVIHYTPASKYAKPLTSKWLSVEDGNLHTKFGLPHLTSQSSTTSNPSTTSTSSTTSNPSTTSTSST